MPRQYISGKVTGVKGACVYVQTEGHDESGPFTTTNAIRMRSRDAANYYGIGESVSIYFDDATKVWKL